MAHSLGARGFLILLSALATTTLSLAAILAWRGYWPILAIALIQVALVLWIPLHAWRDAWIVEELLIGAQQIRVRRSRYRDWHEFRLEPAWARARVDPPRYPGYSPRVVLCCVNQHVEGGSHLTVGEKNCRWRNTLPMPLPG